MPTNSDLPTNSDIPSGDIIYGVVDENDLSNGHYTNQHRRFNLNSTEDVKRWTAILNWLKTLGVPSDTAQFITYRLSALGGSAFGPTTVNFHGVVAEGREVDYTPDAVMLFSYPDTFVSAFQSVFMLQSRGILERFPGVDQFLQQQGDSPIGKPAPERNTPGWSLPFSRYYETGAGYVKGKTLNPYETASGEKYHIVSLQVGLDRSHPIFVGSTVKDFWERLR